MLTTQEPASAPPYDSTPAGSPPSLRRREAVGVASLTVAGWLAALWVSLHVHPDPTLARVALFVHLACLVAGLGAVTAVDYLALLWLLGRRGFRQVVSVGGALSGLIWTGLVGLIASGSLLTPDLSNPLTRVKLGLVLVVAVNGACAGVVHRHLAALGAAAPRSALLRGAVTATVSLVGWWGAAVVGFLNSGC